jgi:hypothetical protein
VNLVATRFEIIGELLDDRAGLKASKPQNMYDSQMKQQINN